MKLSKKEARELEYKRRVYELAKQRKATEDALQQRDEYHLPDSYDAAGQRSQRYEVLTARYRRAPAAQRRIGARMGPAQKTKAWPVQAAAAGAADAPGQHGCPSKVCWEAGGRNAAASCCWDTRLCQRWQHKLPSKLVPVSWPAAVWTFGMQVSLQAPGCLRAVLGVRAPSARAGRREADEDGEGAPWKEQETWEGSRSRRRPCAWAPRTARPPPRSTTSSSTTRSSSSRTWRSPAIWCDGLPLQAIDAYCGT